MRRSGPASMTSPIPPRRTLTNLLLGAFVGFWVALVAVPPVAFMRWRDTRLGELSTSPAQAEWDRFRADMQAQSGERGPVRRKVPRSPEPPERIWLRDYPLVVVAAWVIFVGLLGIVIGFMLRGAVRPGPGQVSGPA